MDIILGQKWIAVIDSPARHIFFTENGPVRGIFSMENGYPCNEHGFPKELEQRAS